MAQGEATTRPVETQRLDAFVDAAFAFAVSLLIIAGAEPLNDIGDLMRAMGRIPAFAAGFALVVVFWMGHRNFGRLAPVRDGWSALLSLAIVCTILIYVFPLRLLTEAGLGFFSGGRLPGVELIRSFDHLRAIYAVYGLGFAFLAWLYFLLFAHALRRPDACGLEATDRGEARQARNIWGMIALVGLASAIVAWTPLLSLAPWLPGFTYWLIPFGIFLLGLTQKRHANV